MAPFKRHYRVAGGMHRSAQRTLHQTPASKKEALPEKPIIIGGKA
jgi:hypothetical protein